ncbi:MAG TPA: hypothetical protein VFP56_01955 [Candidatus Limnocylindrales bacterium]|nr:hypothetical protein [Candidatus Limnocylindrales bacterium]
MTDQLDAGDFQRAADLRVASDTFMKRLDRLFELESRKRELPPDEPEFVRLAREIEDLSRELLSTSGQQVELAEDVHADVKTGDLAANLPIRETPPRRDAVAVLGEWRAAERSLAAAPPGSQEEADARAAVERLRVEYRRITVPHEPREGTF